MSAGREDLGRAAIERKQLIAGEVGSLDQQITELESEQDKLIQSERQLQAKVEQFRSKKEVIKAQYSAAEGAGADFRGGNGVGDGMADVGAAMQRAIDKTDQMQHARQRSRSFRRRVLSRPHQLRPCSGRC